MARSWSVSPLLLLALSACSVAQTRPGDPWAPTAEIQQFSDARSTSHFAALQPMLVRESSSLESDRVLLGIGALYARPEDPRGRHSLALVIRTQVSRDAPLLSERWGVLFEVDGQCIESNPQPGGHIYTVEGNGEGVEETVMIPVDPGMFRRIAGADVVRGRIGPWFSFMLPRARRGDLLRILEEIPREAYFATRALGPVVVSGF